MASPESGSAAPIRVVHVTDGSVWAGMESHLLQLHLAGRERPDAVDARFVFSEAGPVADRFRAEGAAVLALPGSGRARIRALRRHLREARPHVVHAHGYLGVLWAGLASVGLDAELLVTLHASVEPGPGPGTRIWWYNRLARWLPVLRAGAFVAVCEDVRDDYVRRWLPAARIRVVRNGLLCRRGEPAPREAGAPPRIGCVGRLVPVKDHALFLRVVERLRRSRPALEGWILGDGPLRGALESEARERGLGSGVAFLGGVDDVAERLDALDVLVFTSRSEGVPYALLEALCAGLPVVAPRVGGLPEVLRHEENALLADARSAESIAEGVERILADPALARRLSAGARRSVAGELSAERMLDETLAVYRERLAR